MSPVPMVMMTPLTNAFEFQRLHNLIVNVSLFFDVFVDMSLLQLRCSEGTCLE